MKKVIKSFLLVALFGTTFFAQSMDTLEWPGMDTLEWPEGGNLSLTPISALEAATGQRGSLAPHPLDCSSCGKSTICLSLEDPNRCLCEIDQSLLTTPLMTPAGIDALEHAASLSQPSNAAPDPLFTLFLDGTTTVLTQGALPPQASATAQPLSHPQETQGGYDEEESSAQEGNPKEPSTVLLLQSLTPLKGPNGVWYCPCCDYSFDHKGVVTKHLRMHTGEKSFACSVCNKKLATTTDLKKHQQKHFDTRPRPFKCPLCEMCYLRQGDLKGHMRQTHRT